jgi:hypothetical protein
MLVLFDAGVETTGLYSLPLLLCPRILVWLLRLVPAGIILVR